MVSNITFSVEGKARSKEFNWDEAAEVAENMLQMAELMVPFQQEEQRRERKLKEFPKGFHLEGKGYSCAICGNSCSGEDTWYDQYGIKCMNCQEAINREEIPAYCAEDKEKWYSAWDMERAFHVRTTTLKRWVREGVLKARTIPHETYADVLLLLIEDNKNTLPPKKLVEDRWSNEYTSDGRVISHSEPWYQGIDPFQYLKGYKIMDYLEMKDGRLELKKKK